MPTSGFSRKPEASLFSGGSAAGEGEEDWTSSSSWGGGRKGEVGLGFGLGSELGFGQVRGEEEEEEGGMERAAMEVGRDRELSRGRRGKRDHRG